METEWPTFIVPRPLAQVGRIGVPIDVTWPIFNEEAEHGTATRAAVKPYRQWRVLWILARLEKPEERIDRVVLILVEVGQFTRREVNVSRI